MSDARRVVFAIAAHPDDIEFQMAGTLLLLGAAGYQLHYLTIGNGSCGTATQSKEEIIRVRTGEAQAAAAKLGATYHLPYVDDIDVLFESPLLARVASVVREVDPSLLLVPSPQDYMEDHTNAQRLAVTAAFCRGMRNFPTDPPRPPTGSEVTVYHAMPAGLRDPLRRRVIPEYFVDVTGTLPAKRELLAQHRSQKEWLDVSQGMDSYLIAMEEMAAEVGRLSGAFAYAEGWRRRSHLGFCAEGADPLVAALGRSVLINEAYRRGLDEPSP